MSSNVNLDVLGNPIPIPTPKPIPTSNKSNGIPMWILFLLLLGTVIYFMPSILSYLSLPEKIVEEEIIKEVERVTEKKIVDDIELEELEKGGYCYIGTDRGIRSCIDVKPGDHCMSGKIFPRRDICVNPSLRM